MQDTTDVKKALEGWARSKGRDLMEMRGRNTTKLQAVKKSPTDPKTLEKLKRLKELAHKVNLAMVNQNVVVQPAQEPIKGRRLVVIEVGDEFEDNARELASSIGYDLNFLYGYALTEGMEKIRKHGVEVMTMIL